MYWCIAMLVCCSCWPRNGSIRFELMRNENIGPSMRQALQFIEQIVQNCCPAARRGGGRKLFLSSSYISWASMVSVMCWSKRLLPRCWSMLLVTLSYAICFFSTTISYWAHVRVTTIQSPHISTVCRGQVSWADAIAVSGAAVYPHLLWQGLFSKYCIGCWLLALWDFWGGASFHIFSHILNGDIGRFICANVVSDGPFGTSCSHCSTYKLAFVYSTIQSMTVGHAGQLGNFVDYTTPSIILTTNVISWSHAQMGGRFNMVEVLDDFSPSISHLLVRFLLPRAEPFCPCAVRSLKP